MDALEMALLYDYYGGMLTEKQRQCYEMRYDQDLSLGEIGQELGVSRQAVCDTLSRTESYLRRMEESAGCVARSLRNRRARQRIEDAARALTDHPDETVARLAGEILAAAGTLEE